MARQTRLRNQLPQLTATSTLMAEGGGGAVRKIRQHAFAGSKPNLAKPWRRQFPTRWICTRRQANLLGNACDEVCVETFFIALMSQVDSYTGDFFFIFRVASLIKAFDSRVFKLPISSTLGDRARGWPRCWISVLSVSTATNIQSMFQCPTHCWDPNCRHSQCDSCHPIEVTTVRLLIRFLEIFIDVSHRVLAGPRPQPAPARPPRTSAEADLDPSWQVNENVSGSAIDRWSAPPEPGARCTPSTASSPTRCGRQEHGGCPCSHCD